MPPKQFRKRGRSNSSDDDDAGAPAVDLARIRELREDQRLRGRAGGIDAAKALTLAPADVPPSSSAGAGAAEAPAAASEGPGGGLGKFAAARTRAGGNDGAGGGGAVGGSGAGDGDGGEDPLLLAFIEERMRGVGADGAAAGGAGGDRALASSSSSSSSSSSGPLTAEAMLLHPERLYELPENLRAPPKVGAAAAGASAAARAADPGGGSRAGGRSDADVGTGGVMLGGIGIAEVTLPDAEKERNARDTERLREMLMAKRARAAAVESGGGRAGAGRETFGPSLASEYEGAAGEDTGVGGGGGGEAAHGGGGRGGPTRSLAGSYTANYSHHRREHALVVKGVVAPGGTALFDSRPLTGGRGGGGAGGGGGGSGEGRDGHKGGGGQHNRDGQHGPRREHASDDKLFSRFKRQENANLRNK
jgi:hypothetical protein